MFYDPRRPSGVAQNIRRHHDCDDVTRYEYVPGMSILSAVTNLRLLGVQWWGSAMVVSSNLRLLGVQWWGSAMVVKSNL